MSKVPFALRSFDAQSGGKRRVLEERYGADEAAALLAEARNYFEHLLPTLPNEGSFRYLMDGFFMAAIELLAYGKVLRNHGATPDEIGRFIDEVSVMPLERWPKLRAWIGRAFIGLMVWRLPNSAKAFIDDPETATFQFSVVDEPKASFAMDVTDCGICRVAHREGMSDLMPFICALDDKQSDAMELRLERSGTIGTGATHCDFRYKKPVTPPED